MYYEYAFTGRVLSSFCSYASMAEDYCLALQLVTKTKSAQNLIRFVIPEPE